MSVSIASVSLPSGTGGSYSVSNNVVCSVQQLCARMCPCRFYTVGFFVLDFFPSALYLLGLVELRFLYWIVHHYNFCAWADWNEKPPIHTHELCVARIPWPTRIPWPFSHSGTLLLILTFPHSTGSCLIFSRTFYIQLWVGWGWVHAVKKPEIPLLLTATQPCQHWLCKQDWPGIASCQPKVWQGKHWGNGYSTPHANRENVVVFSRDSITFLLLCRRKSGFMRVRV